MHSLLFRILLTIVHLFAYSYLLAQKEVVVRGGGVKLRREYP